MEKHMYFLAHCTLEYNIMLSFQLDSEYSAISGTSWHGQFMTVLGHGML